MKDLIETMPGLAPDTWCWPEWPRSALDRVLLLAVVLVMAALLIPAYRIFDLRQHLNEGVRLLTAAQPAIERFHAAHGRLPAHLHELGWPSSGGGPLSERGHDAVRTSFAEAFGVTSSLWRALEWDAVDDHAALVLRTQGSPLTEGIDIGLHLQVRAVEGGLRFRCVVNEQVRLRPHIPGICRLGSPSHWDW